MVKQAQVDFPLRLFGVRAMAVRACAVEDFLPLANPVLSEEAAGSGDGVSAAFSTADLGASAGAAGAPSALAGAGAGASVACCSRLRGLGCRSHGLRGCRVGRPGRNVFIDFRKHGSLGRSLFGGRRPFGERNRLSRGETVLHLQISNFSGNPVKRAVHRISQRPIALCERDADRPLHAGAVDRDDIKAVGIEGLVHITGARCPNEGGIGCAARNRFDCVLWIELRNHGYIIFGRQEVLRRRVLLYRIALPFSRASSPPWPVFSERAHIPPS